MKAGILYFPKPYPDEWWYSVLCRYYVRAGHLYYADVMAELYGRRKQKHERLFPNGSSKIILDRMPDIGLTQEDVLLNHTLMPYYLRFYPIEQKTAFYNMLLRGEGTQVRAIWQETTEGEEGIRYCPQCYQEDKGRYGEPYWHREHQITLMPLCPKHLCHLKTYSIKHTSRIGAFLPLCAVSPEENDESAFAAWEKPLTETLVSYLSLPFEVGPTNGYNNLYEALVAEGYQHSYRHGKEALNSKVVKQACLNFYGEEIYHQYFTRSTGAILNILEQWGVRAPERYALLSVLCGLTADGLFGPQIEFENTPKGRLMKCWKEGVVYPKKELAKIVGVGTVSLEKMIQECGIKPMWARYKGKERREHIIHVALTESELKKIKAAAAQYGGGALSVFAREMLLRYTDMFLDKVNPPKKKRG